MVVLAKFDIELTTTICKWIEDEADACQMSIPEYVGMLIENAHRDLHQNLVSRIPPLVELHPTSPATDAVAAT